MLPIDGNNDVSGKLIRPDGKEEYWWQGVNCHNVIPEDLVDAVVKREKEKVENDKTWFIKKIE